VTLELCSLELRRLYFDLYMCYRIIFGQVNVCIEFNNASQTRGHAVPTNCINDVATVMCELHTLLFVLVCGMLFQCVEWDVKPCSVQSFPADRVDFSSFAAFKRTVQQIDLSMFLLCY